MVKRLPARALVGVLLAAPSAGAQTPADIAASDDLFKQAQALLEAGKVAEACPKLEESQRLQPASGGIAFALATCWEKQGKTASAYGMWRTGKSLARQKGRPKDEAQADERIAALESQLSRLSIVVPPSVAALSGLTVKRDGAVVGPGQWGTGVPIDPGPHIVEVTAPGRAVVVSKVDVRAGTVASITVTEPAALPPAVVTPPPGDEAKVERTKPKRTTEEPEPVSSRAEPAPEPPRAGRTLRLAGLAGIGAGSVALGVAGYFALKAGSLTDEQKALCPGSCPDAATQEAANGKHDDAGSARSTATVVGIVGGVLVVGGLVVVLTAPSERAVSMRVIPVIGAGTGGVTGVVSF